ncbi:MAG: UDP-glucose/GDP-mannose dehydrogenase family protein, partial [Desulfurococcaceae archaeon]
KIKVHDPKAMDNVKKIYGDKLVYCNNPIDAIKDSDAVIIATAWREYRRLKPEDYLRLMRNPVVIDGRRIYDNYRDFVEKGVKFYAIGLSKKQCL